MNQGRIWTVVHPTVGLPLLLGSVAVTSLVVHASIMTHTTWMSNYWQGAKAKTASAGDVPVASNTASVPAYTVSVVPVASPSSNAPASFVITMTPNVGTPVKAEQAASKTPPVPFKAASTN